MTIKKLFSRAAAVVLSLCLVGGATGFEPGEFAAFAETTKGTYEYFEYENTGSSITITGQSAEAKDVSELIIPSYIDGLPVTAISGNSYKFGFEKLVIPETVTTIDPSSSLLSSTQYIDVSEDNTNYCDIDGVVFSKDKKTIVRYPGKRVGGYSIPDTVTKVGDYSFANCGTSLLSIDIPDSVKVLGRYCFTCSYDMESITVPESVDLIDEGAFRLYGYIESITILNPYCTIGEEVFAVIAGAIIYGYDGSTAADYVNSSFSPDYIIFKSLGEYKAKTDLIYQTKKDSSVIRQKVGCPKDLNSILDETNSTTYSPELAYMLSIMSQSAYNEECVRANYRELGFKDQTDVYDYDTTYTQADNCGYVIGYQDLEDGTREFLITVRGTASDILTEFYKPPCGDPAEWFSDFNMGFSQLEFFGDYPKFHNGFYVAAQRIWESLKKYNNGTIRTDKVRYVLTGHSRGAAVSNLVSHALMEAGVKKSAMYSYNFACPDVAIGDDSHFLDARMNSIFNLNCARDLVGQVPGSAGTFLSRSAFRALIGDIKYWGKFGRTYFWDVDWESSLPANVLGLVDYHPCDTNYIPYFSWEYPLSDFKTYAEMKSIQNSNIMDWSTPIKVVHATIRPQPTYISAYAFDDTTVKITDKDGKVVGTVKDNSVSIESGYEDKIQTNFTGDSVDIAIDADSGYQISVESEAPATIAVVQENAAYNSVNNGAVYTAQPGNTTIDIAPDTPAAETPVTDNSGKAIEPDKVWNLGDVNGDRSANIADAVVLQRWLLNKPDSDLTEWTAADIYEDGKLNVYDLTLLKQLITE